MTTEYQSFLGAKRKSVQVYGFEVDPSVINQKLFPFQRDIVRWALRLGRAAMFEECGLGKTAQYLEWSRLVAAHTGGKVIILAPLAVAHQTVREGDKFGIPVTYCREQSEVGDASIIVTNYERLEKFEPGAFAGVVLDESSILKSFTGKTKRQLVEAFATTPYRLCCTATPAPNDHLEFGNHAQFLGVMDSIEMIGRWFINDTMSAGSYRLKQHSAKDYWYWLTSWAVCLSNPADLGAQYEVEGYELPPLLFQEHPMAAALATIERAHAQGMLFADTNPSSTTLHKVKRESLPDRVMKARQIIDQIADDAPVLIWCDTNEEADALTKEFPEAVEVRGSHSPELKEKRLIDFGEERIRMLITKPDIAGFGLNYQHCSNMVFVGVSFSFEKTYQALRRSWRFGQENPVHAHMIYSEGEGSVMAILRDKQERFKEMQSSMNAAMSEHGLFRDYSAKMLQAPEQDIVTGDNFTMYLGDCVEETKKLADNSVHFGIHSPPFANLYIYSDSEADMGNSANNAEFFAHYDYLIKELYRVTIPGRLVAVHCKDLPLYRNRDGAMGLYDFPGAIREHFEAGGWTFHSRVTIWKDPVIEMERTKNHGLLHKNFTSGAEACRQGMADYLMVFRKWSDDIDEAGIPVLQNRQPGDYIGDNPPAAYEYANARGKRTPQSNYSIAVWQRYASPVWFDISQTRVLNYQQSKDVMDEKHICPLQLDVIERAIDLWTNPGETVFSPFAGIGSEVYSAVKLGRIGVGVELKRSYFNSAVRYCQNAEIERQRPTLFDLIDAAEAEAVR